jgi:hypothetical protein
MTTLLRPEEIEGLNSNNQQETSKRELSESAPSIFPTLSPTTSTNVDLDPPDCIRSEDDLGYVNGLLSFEVTFYNCLKNVADASALPTLINGSAQAVMTLGTNIILNNLHKVSHCTHFTHGPHNDSLAIAVVDRRSFRHG